MELNNCIKFAYCGMKRFIINKLDSNYEDIIQKVQTTFNIPKDYTEAIFVTNGKGYVFEKHIFEYFILLFPQPELTFHIRLDYSKIKSKPNMEVNKIDAVDVAVQEQRLPLGNSRLNNKRARTIEMSSETVLSDQGSDYIATPVRRQNCFLGLIPSSERVDEEMSAEQQQTAKRMRLMQNTRKPLIGRTKKPTTLTKRSLRI